MSAKRVPIFVSVVLVLAGAAVSTYILSRDGQRVPPPRKTAHLRDEVQIDRPFDEGVARVEDAVRNAGLVPISSADWTQLGVSPGRGVRTFQFASPAFVKTV